MPNCGPFLPCVILRMSETPIWLRFRPPGGRKWANTDQNRLRCSGYMYMPDHLFHALSFEYHETPILSSFFGSTRWPKLGQFWQKYNHFWGWSEYISMPHFRPFLLCMLQRMAGNPNLTKFLGHHRAETGPLPHTLQFTPNIDQY